MRLYHFRSLVVAVLLVYAVLAARYVPVWHDDPALWSHARAVTPSNPRAVDNLAKATFPRDPVAATALATEAGRLEAARTRPSWARPLWGVSR